MSMYKVADIDIRKYTKKERRGDIFSTFKVLYNWRSDKEMRKLYLHRVYNMYKVKNKEDLLFCVTSSKEMRALMFGAKRSFYPIGGTTIESA